MLSDNNVNVILARHNSASKESRNPAPRIIIELLHSNAIIVQFGTHSNDLSIFLVFVVQCPPQDSLFCRESAKCHFDPNTQLRQVEIVHPVVFEEIFRSIERNQDSSGQWICIISQDVVLQRKRI